MVTGFYRRGWVCFAADPAVRDWAAHALGAGRAALAGHDPALWDQIDVTEAYRQARREVFATCKRVVVHGAVGAAFLVHRLALHGVAPWAAGARAGPDGRMIAYFRPPMPGGVVGWLAA